MKFIWLSIILILPGCEAKQESKSAVAEASLQLTGELLASNICASCHLYPPPGELDKKSWQKVLPRMSYMLGLANDSIRQKLIEPGEAGAMVKAANVFPDKPVISEEQFNLISEFYLENAKENLPVPPTNHLPTTDLFQVKVPPVQLRPPSATLVKIDQQQLYLGDANKKSLQLFDKNLNLKQVAQLKEGIVDLDQINGAYKILMMGSFSPTDDPSGVLFSLDPRSNQGSGIIIDQLQRPVDAQWSDFDEDGLQDVVICEFGKWTGSLSLYLQQKDGSFTKNILRDKPGAIKAYIHDFNHDNLLDVIALFGQGDEGIFLFENKGDGSFAETTLIRFPASYGSSFFKLQDIDQDGQLDILYTAGDNADFKPVLKPYHGIRIFKNSNGKFKESFFFPVHGAYKAIAEDFDSDGDLDIAAISFFPDFTEKKPLGFVLLQNNGLGDYTPFTIAEVDLGRWIVMDSGDLDKDGDTDLVLGSLAFEVVNDQQNHLQKWVQNGIPFIYLENQTQQPAKQQ